MTDRAPPISIVVGTIQGWPAIKACVESVEEAARQVGGEVVVGDGSGSPPPPPESISGRTTWIEDPGKSVFQTRQRGYEASRGQIVGITEDHCTVPPDWAERMLAAHARHPEAAAIGGVVENAATRRIMDWASFFIVQVAVMPPIRSGPTKRLAGAVNVSYKRKALEALDDFGSLGAMDTLHQLLLRQRKEPLVADGEIRVFHDQSLGFWGTTAIHFHAGRTISGFRRQRMTSFEWLRLVGIMIVPWLRFGRIVAVGGAKEYRNKIATAIPAILWLLYAQAVGQFTGYVRGPGDSPHRVQ